MMKDTYNTVTEAINGLKSKGYSIDFNILYDKDCLICSQHQIELSEDEFQVEGVFRFDGPSDPGDEMVVYAIASKKFNVKGVLVNAYGVYSEIKSSKLVSKLKL